MNQNKSGSLYYLLILVVFAAIFIVAGISFLQTNGKSAKKSPSEDLSNDNQQTQNENDRTSELSADQQFYALGVKDFENKEYEKTVSDLAQAIASNPSVINYY